MSFRQGGFERALVVFDPNSTIVYTWIADAIGEVLASDAKLSRKTRRVLFYTATVIAWCAGVLAFRAEAKDVAVAVSTANRAMEDLADYIAVNGPIEAP